ncbi:TfoX-like protein [Haloactinopolyspora alba]|uniref:TfoX-like protein n=1 Tax=Haloactinopolyspora alba TaxID=648780 RepID=A0A2P8DT89_9ACTN|nr:TfoX/Sxy family protein [Haloactinopolyspora alba]PSL00433.1 TfoX-like protein [Haloactinopolyspora alba]
MTSTPTALTGRVRAALSGEPSTREVSMFGGLSFMVDEKILVAVGRDDVLLVRIDPARHDELLALAGATQAEMGTGRSMGPGWIHVVPDALATDDDLSFWLDVAREYNTRARRTTR